ncbi:cytochrome P450 [Streptomyces anulatus]
MTIQEADIDAIGIFDPMDPRLLKAPFAAYRRLRDHAPVARLAPLDIWAVSRHADVRSVLADPDAFSAALAFGKDAVLTDTRRPGLRLNLRFSGEAGGVVSSSDGEGHARLRRTVARLMSRPRLDAVETGVREHLPRILGGLRDRSAFDVVDDLAKPVATKAIGDVIGLGDDTARSLAAWADLTARALDPGDELALAAAAPGMMLSNLTSARTVTSALDARAAGLPEGAGSGLVEAWRAADSQAAREETILSVLQLFQAGYETIVSALAHIVAGSVADRPEWAARVGNPEELAGLIDEGTRLASPVRATFRTAVGGQRIGGTAVPDGARIMVLIGSANRDERVFADPDRMRPGRATPHAAFGAGPHRCLGRVLAQMELRHVLLALASATRSVSALGGERVAANILKAGYDRLPVAVEWRR